MRRLAIVIPTLNEALHIGRCIESAVRLGDVIVVDCGSTDGTIEIARRLGARVLEHGWEGYARQKNWALGSLTGEYEWVLFLDADEWITPHLAIEVDAAIEGEAIGYNLPRRNVFEGRPLKHAWWYPDYQLRLFRMGRGRFEDRLVHEHVIVDGAVGYLHSPLMHENLKGLAAFMARHERYADLEAREILKWRQGASGDQRRGRLFGSWPERRRFLKVNVWYRLPLRPAIRFLWMYLVRRGFLDGHQGRVYCQLIAAYEAMIDAKLLEIMRGVNLPRADAAKGYGEIAFSCPICHSGLAAEIDSYLCTTCGRTYPVRDGVPLLVNDPSIVSHDEIDHILEGSVPDHRHTRDARAHKAAQASHFDRAVLEDFEVRRPHGTPRWYRFLLREKFRRAVEPYKSELRSATALTVCGGSGMDAEYLARSGAVVISSDLSSGAASRVLMRSRRYGATIRSVVADVEHLPFPDKSFDVVFVHDGLHHLEDPVIGLREMLRVSSRWVSVTEPAAASVSSVAMRLGLAKEREEAGNRVARMTIAEVVREMAAAGYRPLVAERYAMYYKHIPGRASVFLSKPLVNSVARASWRMANWMLRRAGNKLVVVGERMPLSETAGDNA